MNLNTVFGTKIGQSQGFLENGKRIPLSRILIGQNVVTQRKTMAKDGYEALQVGFGTTKKISKSAQGHIKKAGVEKNPRFFKEIKVEEDTSLDLGTALQITEILKPGDLISVTGTSKGKGYAGVVKRHNFSGGPRTHGQSDRERAPGSIGQSTTPGRVYKGKRMAGRMGNDQVTIHNLVVIDIEDETVLIKGLVPGGVGTVIKIVKKGEAKNFVPLYKGEKTDEIVEESAQPAQDKEETPTKENVEEAQPSDDQKAEIKEEDEAKEGEDNTKTEEIIEEKKETSESEENK